MNIKNEKGIALIMSIGIVAMLAIIGTTFAINMRLEQKASANYLAGIKAKILAEAGIDHAIAVLRLYAITQAYSDIDDDWRWYGTAIKIYGTSDYSGAYEVSAIDCASQIYINDGLYLTGASKTERDIRLKAMLNNLCVAIGGSLANGDGDTIVDRRPSGADGGYITKEIVRQVLNTAKYNDIKNYITVNTWIDLDTIRPLGSAATPEIQARAPVNVNTASEEVLRAVLQGVSTGEVITLLEARDVAKSLISQSNVRPFTNWNGALLTGGFNTYINDQVPAIITQTKADIIKANANPNTKLNRLNPNSSWKAQAPADKTEMTVNTTEFCFNSMGYYELESTGTVTIGSATVAQKKIRAVVKLYDLWRQTTQAQFEAGNKGTPDYVSTYPEFDPDESTVSASTQDGQIMIKKNAMDSSNPSVIFRASFTGESTAIDDNLDAQTGPGGTNSTTSLNQASIFTIGDLYSDGVHISGSKSLTYLTSSNFPAASTDEGTIEMWVKPDYDITGSSGIHYFFSFQDAPAATEYVRLFDDNGTLKFQVDDSILTLLETISSITTWSANEWHHIAATWDWDNSVLDDGSGVTVIGLIVDGAAPVTATGSGIYNVAPLPTNMYIGSDSAASPANQASATIGEVRIWNSIQSFTPAILPDLYQDSTDGTFTSVSKSIGTVARRLGTISWTESVPVGDIKFQINGSGSYGDDLGSETSIGKAGGSSVISPTTSTSIQYIATLSASGTPLKDTPVLDDVTITYLSPVRFFSWQEVAE